MNAIRSRLGLATFSVAVALAFLASIPVAPAEDPKEPAAPPAGRARPIPAVDFHIPWMGFRIFAMNAESNKPVLGRPTVPPNDLRYFYLPLFAFQKNGAGQLDVTVGDDGEVTLPLIYDSEEARQAVRDYLVKEKLIPANSMSGQVMTVAAKMWRLETAPGYEPRVTFGPYENFQFGMKGQLHTRLAPDKAGKFVDDLKAGRVELQATIVFDGYTYQENTVVVYADDILNSDQFKKLTGPGGKGFVGRHQVTRIAREACLTRSVSITTEYDDPDFNDLVKNLVFNFAQKESKPVADWDALEKFFKDAGWDPNDFKADLIEAAKMNQNKEFRDTFSQEIEQSRKVNAGGGFLGISLNAGVETSDKNKVFKDVLDKWSISSEWNGKQYVPKSIDVYTLNTASIRQASAFAVGKRKKTVSDGILTAAINPNDNVLHAKATPAYEEQLADLVERLTELNLKVKDLGDSNNQKVADLVEAVTALQSRKIIIQRVGLRWTDPKLGADVPEYKEIWKSLMSGGPGQRGGNFRIPFPTPFDSTPQVLVAINSFDASGLISVTGVTEKDFEVRLVTDRREKLTEFDFAYIAIEPTNSKPLK